MAHTPLEIFKVIIMHNKLLDEAAFEALTVQTTDPEEIMNKMLMGDLVSEGTANKVMALYQRNLEKTGLKPAGSTPPAQATPAAPSAPSSHAPAHVPPTHAPPAHAPAAPPAAHAPPKPADAHAPAHAAPATSSFQVGAGGPIALLHQLLKRAREARASDLHLKADARPIVRVAGSLRDLDPQAVPAQALEDALLGILSDAQRARFLEHFDIDFSYGTPELGRFRANYLREHRGMDAIFRLISEKVPSFDELKLPEVVKRFTQYRQGVVLVTGPKGSGKTTTLAALIDLINANRPEHIISIEDPIEFVHPCKKGHVNQREVGPHTESFANALRASLREAPDVIMVGEMRDLETTSLAITAAETGHLVFATLHTPDAARTIGRVLDVFPPKEQAQIRAMFSESLRGIVSQQLVPGLDGVSMHLAVEILFNTSAIGNLIRDNRAFQLKGTMQTGKKLGMCLMDDSLVKLVKEHKISKEEAIARADNVGLMEKDMAGIA